MKEKPLPKKRRGTTYEVVISGAAGRSKIYLRTGLYADGTLGEIFVDCAKLGSEQRSLVNCWAIAFSIALQEGAHLGRLIKAFEGVSFEPKGKVECPVEGVTECSSIPDAVCRILDAEFAAKHNQAPEPIE